MIFRRFIPVLISLAFCHAAQCAPAEAVEIAGSDGHAIKTDAPVQSVVSLYGSLNEILLALDRGGLIKARTNADAHIPELAHLPSIGTHMRPNLELIAAARPDVVLQITGRGEAARDVQALRDLGINVLVFEIDSFEQLFDVTKKLGELTGSSAKAASLVESWRNSLASLAKKHKERPKVFYEARYPNLLAAGAKGIVNNIILAAGGENVVTAPKKLARMSEEALLAKKPDFYIMQKGPMNPDPPPLSQRPNYQSLKTRAIVVDERKFARPGPRSVDAAIQLEKMLHERQEKP